MNNERTNERIRAFAYVTAEKASLYRAIMRVFVQSKQRMALHLRPQEVLDEVRASGLRPQPAQAEIEAALAQLCDWGNLQTHPDTTDVKTVEDFYKQRYVFGITNQGEAAERSLELFETTPERKGELQANALADIRDLLESLRQLSKDPLPASRKIHRSLVALRTCFEELTSHSHAFMSGLQRKLDFQVTHTIQLTTDIQRLIDYVEHFLGELTMAGDGIAQVFHDIDAAGLERLLQGAAEHSLIDAVETTPADLALARDQWRSSWERFREWFISHPERPSKADTLRAHVRAAMPALLSVLTSLNDQRISRINRTNDMRVLARWFAEAETDADAHRLWRLVFGLGPARHLITNDATLDQHEAHDVSSDTSWLDAPPLRISNRLRAHGSYSRSGRLSRIIDRMAEKKKLAAASQEEALRILRAQNRFATGHRMRLSELGQLETDEFDVFLDLLGEAVSAEAFSGDTTEILSNDGCLRLTLEPTRDGRAAVIHTPEGLFSGSDHWISIEPIPAEEVVR